MFDPASIAAAVMGGIMGAVTAGAVIARKLNGNGRHPIPSCVEKMTKHDVQLGVVQTSLAEISRDLKSLGKQVDNLSGKVSELHAAVIKEGGLR